MQPIESDCVVVQFGRKLIVNTRHFYRSKQLSQPSTRGKKHRPDILKENSVNTEHRRLNLVTLIGKLRYLSLKHSEQRKRLRWGRVQLADDARVLVIAQEKESRCEARAPQNGVVCLFSSLKSNKTEQGAPTSNRVLGNKRYGGVCGKVHRELSLLEIPARRDASR